jgi:hypothetical protein
MFASTYRNVPGSDDDGGGTVVVRSGASCCSHWLWRAFAIIGLVLGITAIILTYTNSWTPAKEAAEAFSNSVIGTVTAAIGARKTFAYYGRTGASAADVLAVGNLPRLVGYVDVRPRFINYRLEVDKPGSAGTVFVLRLWALQFDRVTDTVTHVPGSPLMLDCTPKFGAVCENSQVVDDAITAAGVSYALGVYVTVNGQSVLLWVTSAV